MASVSIGVLGVAVIGKTVSRPEVEDVRLPFLVIGSIGLLLDSEIVFLIEAMCPQIALECPEAKGMRCRLSQLQKRAAEAATLMVGVDGEMIHPVRAKSDKPR